MGRAAGGRIFGSRWAVGASSSASKKADRRRPLAEEQSQAGNLIFDARCPIRAYSWQAGLCWPGALAPSPALLRPLKRPRTRASWRRSSSGNLASLLCAADGGQAAEAGATRTWRNKWLSRASGTGCCAALIRACLCPVLVLSTLIQPP